MEIIRTKSEMQLYSQSLKRSGKSIALVTTMGFLHRGHLSLINIAQQKADICIASIFVNPLQFNNLEDFEKYPSDLEHDKKLLIESGVDVLFIPDTNEIYPAGFQTSVEVSEVSKPLEGKFRPGHFKGVSTVLSIFFNAILPDFAVFGEKDFQQLALVRQMCRDLAFPIEILQAPIIRESDGLALSSRNVRLTTPASREMALNLSKSLLFLCDRLKSGSDNYISEINEAKKKFFSDPAIKLEYLEVVDEKTLQPVEGRVNTQNQRALVAAWVGGVRLIDTMKI